MIKFNYNDGGRADAGFKTKAEDCVCRSIAIVTNFPYNDIYKYLAEHNAKQRKSKSELKKSKGKKTASYGIYTNRKWFKEYMKALGFEWVPTMEVGKGCKVHLREVELPKGRIVAKLSRHLTAVIDGELHDTYDCSRGGNRCVYGYWILK